jgi:hypothetical protein
MREKDAKAKRACVECEGLRQENSRLKSLLALQNLNRLVDCTRLRELRTR